MTELLAIFEAMSGQGLMPTVAMIAIAYFWKKSEQDHASLRVLERDETLAALNVQHEAQSTRIVGSLAKCMEPIQRDAHWIRAVHDTKDQRDGVADWKITPQMKDSINSTAHGMDKLVDNSAETVRILKAMSQAMLSKDTIHGIVRRATKEAIRIEKNQ